MKIKEVIEEGKNVLSKNNIEDNVIITRELLAFVLGVEKQYLVIHLTDELNAEDYIKFKKDSAAGKFSWNLENGILTDPDGYVNKKPAEILKDIFQEK